MMKEKVEQMKMDVEMKKAEEARRKKEEAEMCKLELDMQFLQLYGHTYQDAVQKASFCCKTAYANGKVELLVWVLEITTLNYGLKYDNICYTSRTFK